jgi:hypothetical protein
VVGVGAVGVVVERVRGFEPGEAVWAAPAAIFVIVHFSKNFFFDVFFSGSLSGKSQIGFASPSRDAKGVEKRKHFLLLSFFYFQNSDRE